MNSIKDNAFRFLLMCAAGLVLAVLIRCDPSWGQSGSPRSRVALLIGNASYPDASAPLQQPTKSIHILADELRRSGFRVDTRENLGKQELLRAVDEFKQAIEPGSAALFFFSGYGLQKDRESFVIPVDAQIWTEADIARDGVSIEAILSDMGRARVKLMILDASRRNPYERRFRRAPAGLAPIIAPAGSLIMSAAAPGKVLDDTGIFINELVKEMRGPALTVETIVSRARRGVARLSKGEQVLWMSSSLVDDFFLKEPQGPKVANREQQQSKSDRADQGRPSRQQRTPNPPQGADRKTAALDSSRVDSVAPPLKPGDVLRDCADCPEMVVVPAGRFDMGSNEFAVEKPVHRVEIARAFAIGRREVTFEQWDKCVSAGKCTHSSDDAGRGRGARPVTDVSWSDAKAYVAWLSQEIGHAYRLPSEAEWEYAARGGTRTAFWWGRAMSQRFANCRDCGRTGADQTVIVGSYYANPFGLSETAGNAAEWVEDCWNEDYRKAPRDGSAWTSGDCRQRVLRGGSFDSPARYLRSASRFRYDADVRYFANGFRVVRDLP